MSNFSEFYLRNCEEQSSIPKVRRHNFDLLEGEFELVNKLKLVRSSESVPLCYPLLTEKKFRRQDFIDNGIFAPRYWPGLTKGKLNEFELKISEDCLFLPCDNRLSDNDVSKMAKLVKNILGYE